jgi:FkbM family methyltransferase
MAAKFGATRVIAFEPNEVLRMRFECNSNLNNFQNIIEISPLALGNKNGRATLMIPTNDLGGSSLVPNRDFEKSVSVKVKRLDDVLREIQITSIDALKIDVEGFEYEVLSPLMECDVTLLPKLIIIEYVNCDSWPEDVIDLLVSNSYTILGKNRSNMFLALQDQHK